MRITYANLLAKHNKPKQHRRGLYIIFPFRYQGSFQSMVIDDKDKEIPPLIFDSGDFIELLSVKCRNGNFVKRFNLNSKLEDQCCRSSESN